MATLADRAVAFLAAHPAETPTADRSVGMTFGPGELSALRGAGWEPCGLVAGASVFHVGVVGWPRGNAEVRQLSGALNSGRDKALSGLRDHATAVGADGVLDVRLDIHFREEHRHLPRFVVTGTAIRAIPEPRFVRHRDRASEEPPPGREARPFTAAVTPAQFSLLLREGYLPAGVVMGTSVFHIGRRDFGQWAATQRQNVEMTGYTEALYEARSLAMARLQEEALGLGADGVVGVTTSEASHVWGDHVIEFFASGTAVRSAAARTGGGEAPRLVLSVADPTFRTQPDAITGRPADAARPTTAR